MDGQWLLSALASRGHVASRRELEVLGLDRIALERFVRSGGLCRVRRGIYATRLADAEQLRALHLGGRIACVSALRRLGVWSGSGDALHVSVAGNASRLRAAPPLGLVEERPCATEWHPSVRGVRHEGQTIRPAAGAAPLVHWDSGLTRSSQAAWIVSPELALAQALRCQDIEHAAACADSIVHEGVLSLDAVRAIILEQAHAAAPSRR